MTRSNKSSRLQFSFLDVDIDNFDSAAILNSI